MFQAKPERVEEQFRGLRWKKHRRFAGAGGKYAPLPFWSQIRVQAIGRRRAELSFGPVVARCCRVGQGVVVHHQRAQPVFQHMGVDFGG